MDSLKYRYTVLNLRERAKSIREGWDRGLIQVPNDQMVEEMEKAATMIEDLLSQCCPTGKEKACCLTCKQLYFKDFSAFCPFQMGPRQPDDFCWNWEESKER